MSLLLVAFVDQGAVFCPVACSLLLLSAVLP